MAFWKPGTAQPTNSFHHFIFIDEPRKLRFLEIAIKEILNHLGGETEREAKTDDLIIIYNPNENLAIDEQRTSLPIYNNRDQIMYLVEKYQVTIIVGQTGCGKTTQIPQYLYEVGWTNSGKIVACTQPRRVAATTIAERVAFEMGVRLGEEVGYTIRFDDTTTKGKTKIKYMTDGMLIREMMSDPLLTSYSVIMLDEAHERSLETDIIIGLLKKILRKRNDLKIIVSSATLDAEDFYRFFNVNFTKDTSKDNVAIMSIEGRMFPVDVLYLQNPCSNYLHKAKEVVFEINKNEGPGDILVFLTGQEEVETLVRLIENEGTEYQSSYTLQPLPIYAGLAIDQQRIVFERAPPRIRKVIVATNIAESSITIDGIAFVIDSGFVKLKAYNNRTGQDTLVVSPISKASAQQRAGRAGRVRPGKCFRLYTEDAFLNLNDNNIPEIQRSNLCQTILQLKALGIDNILRFDFLSSPPSSTLAKSLELLYSLQVVDENCQLTDAGFKLAEFPLEPTIGRMLLASGEFGCSEEIATIAAMLTVQGVFVNPPTMKKQADETKFDFTVLEGDHLTLFNVFRAFTRCKDPPKWCYNHFVNLRSLQKAVSVRKQIVKFLHRFKVPLVSCDGDDIKVRKCIVSGFFSNVAKLNSEGYYNSLRDNSPLYIHPNSCLFQASPQYVVFHDVVLTTKPFMREVTVIDQLWLTELAPHYYKYKEPVNK